jgi:TonB-linked SusC/RagA family outer membrane protein
MKKFLLNLFFLCSAIIYGQAQTKTVSGVVSDDQNSPLPGVNVIIKSDQTQGTITNMDGEYSIEVSETDILVYRFIGMKEQEVTVAGKTTINVVMQSDFIGLDEVVAVGYGTQRKENLTGAVVAIDAGKTLESRPVNNLSKGLQGVAPGLNISFENGRPGTSASLNIRGIGTITSSSEPLVLVDGVPSSLDMVNPEDVENISVLKDAASASIYGARAAFGVVLITTKKGSKGDKVKISYSGNMGWNKPANLVEFMDPTDELPVMIAAQERAGNANAESFGMLYKTLLPGIQNWKEKYANNRTSNEMVYGEDWEIINSRAYFYRVWDPHKEMLQESSPRTTHNLQVNGNLGEKSSYLASFGYQYEEGMMAIQTEKNKKYTFNFNFNTELTKWLKGELRVYSVDTKLEEPYNYYGPGTYGQGANGYFGYYMRWGAFFPYGTYKGTHFRHAPGFLANANMNEYKTSTFRLTGALEAQILKDLSWRTEYTVTTENIQTRVNGGTVKLWNSWGPMDASTIETAQPGYIYGPNSSDDKVGERRLARKNYVLNSYATYKKTFNENHNLKVIGGTNIEWSNNDQIYAEIRGLMDREKPQFKLATGETFISSSRFSPFVYETAIAGFFTRFNYDYKGKYLLEMNGRLDGSSSFPGTDLWGFFPSASVGYRITEEPWMQPVRKVLNDMKIRASYGSIGNQNIGLYRFLPIMGTYESRWIDGEKRALTAGQPSVVDDNISWEKVYTTNVGVDVKFLDMFNLSADWFQRETEGMFAVDKTLPNVFGTSAPLTNAGNLRTRGFELSLDFNKAISSKASVYANVMLSDATTEVTKWNNPAKTLGNYYSGMEVGEIWGLETERLYQESDFVGFDVDKGQWILKDGYADQGGIERGAFAFGPGDVMYKDLNGDGVINAGERTVDKHGDLKKIGNTTPRYVYSFRLGATLHGFDIDAYFQGVGKRDYWAASDLILPFYNRTDALYQNQSDYWSLDNTDAFFPRPYPGHASSALAAGTTGSNNFVTQSRYLLNMSYLRFKNLTIGYTIPKSLTEKINVNKVRVYFSGQNLAEITSDNLPVDPEIDDAEANWGRTYPYARTYSLGLQVTF